MAEYSLGDLLVNIGVNIAGFSDAMTSVSASLNALEDTADSALSHIDGLADGFVEIVAAAGLATGAFDLCKDALEGFSKAQDVQTSFELLTGSADDAKDAFEGLKQTALDLAIPFDDLVGVAQRLAPQFGVGTDALKAVLQAAGDAAAATGRDFGTIADGLDRISVTGQVTTRQLQQFGVSIQDIADYMGVSVTDATALLKKGGEDAQADVDAVTGAIETKFGGAAEAISDNLSGQFKKLKDEIEFALEDVGAALAPVASDLISALEGVKPALDGIVAGIQPVLAGFEGMAAAVHGMVPDFLQILGTSNFWIDLGGTLGLIANAFKTIVDAIHGTILVLTDLVNGPVKGLSANVPQLSKDWKAFADTLTNDVTLGFDKVITAAAEAKAKVAAPGDAPSTPGAPTTKPDYAALLAALQAQQAAKATLHETTTLLNKADSDYADFLKTTYVPDVLSVADATANVQAALENYRQAEIAEANARQALAINPSDVALQNALKDAEAAGAVAKRDYTEAVKDQTVAKTTLAQVTKDLQSADDAIAAATKATYIPALLDHQTALNNIAAAQSSQTAAIQAVKDAESNLAAVYGQSTKSAQDIKDAEDALNLTKKNLTAATTALTQAHNDEKSSLAALSAAAKEVDADEKAAIDTRKLLYAGTTDISSALGNYQAGLDAVRDASDKLADAETTLMLAQQGSDPQALVDATNAAKAARDNLTVATKGLGDATTVLTGNFHVSQDALDQLKQHQDDWSDSMKAAQVAMSDLGIKSAAILDQMAQKADDDYRAIAASSASSDEQIRQAHIIALQDRINADVAAGNTVTADQQLTLAKLKQQEADFQANSVTQWATLFSSIDGDVKTTAASMINTLFTGSGSFHDEAIKGLEDIGEAVVTKFTKPITDSIASLIAGGITDLLSGKGLGGILTSLQNIGTSATSAFKSISDGISSVNLGGLTNTTGTIGASGSGAIGDIVSSGPSAGDTIAGIGQSGGSAASAAGSVVSSLTGIVGAVGGVVSAISGIIGNFQAAQQETTLNAIELNTRITAIAMEGAWQTGNDTETIFAFSKLTSQYASHLPPMRGDLDNINAQIASMAAAMTSQASGAATAAAISTSFGSATSSINDILTGMWGALHTDLVGIWSDAGAIIDQLSAIRGNMTSSAIPGVGGAALSGTVTSDTQLPGLQQFINAVNEQVAAGAINTNPNDAVTTLSLLTTMSGTLNDILKGETAAFAQMQVGAVSMLGDLTQLVSLGTSILPRMDALVTNSTRPAINITVEGNVIGNQDFLNQLATLIAQQINLQGVPTGA